MTHVRIALAAILFTFLSGCGDPQVPGGSTRVVDVSGSPTKVLTVGLEERERGEPVLFLMAGAGTPIEAWNNPNLRHFDGTWISMISALAPVVTYDRPGIGGSPFDGIDLIPERVVEHAHELLSVLEVPPPYILVGHSWGGPLIRYYAGQYPEDIVGMVYLDPSEMTASPAERLGASNEEELTQRQAEFDSVRATLPSTPGLESEARAASEFHRSPVADRRLPDDRDVPTTVLLGIRSPDIRANTSSYMDERFWEERYTRQINRFAKWIQGRPNTTLIVATDLGHFVHRDDPELALEAVRRVVVAVGASRRR